MASLLLVLPVSPAAAGLTSSVELGSGSALLTDQATSASDTLNQATGALGDLLPAGSGGGPLPVDPGSLTGGGSPAEPGLPGAPANPTGPAIPPTPVNPNSPTGTGDTAKNPSHLGSRTSVDDRNLAKRQARRRAAERAKRARAYCRIIRRGRVLFVELRKLRAPRAQLSLRSGQRQILKRTVKLHSGAARVKLRLPAQKPKALRLVVRAPHTPVVSARVR